MEKPPLGVRPRYIVAENRLKELKGAILRFVDSGLCVIPLDWIEEYNELVEYLKNRRS